jgi:hypothetical protein
VATAVRLTLRTLPVAWSSSAACASKPNKAIAARATVEAATAGAGAATEGIAVEIVENAADFADFQAAGFHRGVDSPIAGVAMIEATAGGSGKPTAQESRGNYSRKILHPAATAVECSAGGCRWVLYSRRYELMFRAFAAVLFAIAISAVATAQDFSAKAGLTGDQESPIVDTTGTGTGSADFDPATNMLSVNMSWSGLMGTTTDSHIHCCLTTNPTVGVALGFTATFPMGVTSGSFSQSYNLLDPNVYTANFRTNFGGGTAAGARDALLAGMRNGTAYFNIHTTHRPGGEIRGNITPEPSSIVLALGGIGVLALAYRRHSQ